MAKRSVLELDLYLWHRICEFTVQIFEVGEILLLSKMVRVVFEEDIFEHDCYKLKFIEIGDSVI